MRIDAIIFGGRTSDREPLVRGSATRRGRARRLTLGAEATFAAEGVDGQLRYDPMSMRPFMAYGEGDYARHWLDIIGASSDQPIFAHVNWFQRDPDDGHFRWPGYRENLRALLWLIQLKKGEVTGRETPVGILPRVEELHLEGLEIEQEDPRRPPSRSTPSAGTRRWASARPTSSSSTTSPTRSGRRTAGSPRPWRPSAADRLAPCHAPSGRPDGAFARDNTS